MSYFDLEDYSRFPWVELVEGKKKGEVGLCKENKLSKGTEARKKNLFRKMREVQFGQDFLGGG